MCKPEMMLLFRLSCGSVVWFWRMLTWPTPAPAFSMAKCFPRAIDIPAFLLQPLRDACCQVAQRFFPIFWLHTSNTFVIFTIILWKCYSNHISFFVIVVFFMQSCFILTVLHLLYEVCWSWFNCRKWGQDFITMKFYILYHRTLYCISPITSFMGTCIVSFLLLLFQKPVRKSELIAYFDAFVIVDIIAIHKCKLSFFLHRFTSFDFKEEYRFVTSTYVYYIRQVNELKLADILFSLLCVCVSVCLCLSRNASAISLPKPISLPSMSSVGL